MYNLYLHGFFYIKYYYYNFTGLIRIDPNKPGLIQKPKT